MVGTSMSAGKTMTGKFACQILSDLGYRVIGTKLTGAGRYRDILSFRDHGAAEIYDFVDAGLPSTVVPEGEFRTAIRPLLSHIASRDADFMVVEAGASPLEPYNGAAAIDELGANVCCRILCATDPYAVVGVQQAYGLRPDLVAGPATNTTAALDLVEKLTGLPGINIIDPDELPVFRDFLVTSCRSATPLHRHRAPPEDTLFRISPVDLDHDLVTTQKPGSKRRVVASENGCSDGYDPVRREGIEEKFFVLLVSFLAPASGVAMHGHDSCGALNQANVRVIGLRQRLHRVFPFHDEGIGERLVSAGRP
jgi:hypothetical protein